MSDISLVVTDLDGTLWDRNELIHDRTLQALRELDHRRVPVLVATGRRLRSARQRLRADGLQLPIVALDGAIGRDGDRTFHRRVFEPHEAEALVAAFADVGVSPCLYVEHASIDIVMGDAPSTAPTHLRLVADVSATGDISRAAREHPIYAIGVYGATGEMGAMLPSFSAEMAKLHAVQGAVDSFLGGYSLIVYPAGTTKWAGVKAYCDDRALDATRVLALGDGPNDLALLRGASVACVVSDGCESALELADHIIDPASNGGWATVLQLV